MQPLQRWEATLNLSEAARYGIDGRRLGAPAKGLNIVRLSDGSVRIVIVR